ncbi:hypothetical protein ASC96_28150 [Rhizobium sp. Root1204]|nr:hypothetical protein ASC96_28150 [Rhizobium sp. Root1204]
MSKISFTIVWLILFTLPAGAIERMYAARASCQQVQGIIARDGAVILRFPSKNVPGLTLYTRYVRSEFKCDSDFGISVRNIETADDINCRLKECTRKSRGSNRR